MVRAATTASSLEAEQDSGNITKTRSNETPNVSSSLGTTSGGGPRCQETTGDTIAQTRICLCTQDLAKKIWIKILHTCDAPKIMLKPGEFELWRMRIEQYIQMIDYALWEVIENGATLPKTVVVEGVEKVMPITSAEDKAQRRLEVKARSFQIACELVGVLDEKLAQEDVNKKLLEVCLSPEWNTNAIVCRNKAELETMSMDDLYNNLKVSNEAVNAAHRLTTASTQVNTAYSINIDNLSDAVICSFFASQPNRLEGFRKIQEGSLLLMAMRLLVLISPKWSATTAIRGDILLGSAEPKKSRQQEQGKLKKEYACRNI
ncbi:hypothetical protein Tco_1087036 [Tanacetum coccineum]